MQLPIGLRTGPRIRFLPRRKDMSHSEAPSIYRKTQCGSPYEASHVVVQPIFQKGEAESTRRPRLDRLTSEPAILPLMVTSRFWRPTFREKRRNRKGPSPGSSNLLAQLRVEPFKKLKYQIPKALTSENAPIKVFLCNTMKHHGMRHRPLPAVNPERSLLSPQQRRSNTLKSILTEKASA